MGKTWKTENMKLRNLRVNKFKIIIWSLVSLILIVVFHNDYSENYLFKVDNFVKVDKAFLLNINTEKLNNLNDKKSQTSTIKEDNTVLVTTPPEYVRAID